MLVRVTGRQPDVYEQFSYIGFLIYLTRKWEIYSRIWSKICRNKRDFVRKFSDYERQVEENDLVRDLGAILDSRFYFVSTVCTQTYM